MTAADDGGEVDLPAPMLRIGGREFACRPSVPPWHVVKLARALDDDDDLHALAAMHRFLERLVEPDAWEEFSAFMDDYDLDRGTLDNAIGDVLVEQAGRGKANAGKSSSSSGGSATPPTPPVSRVVSLSKGTVEVGEPSLSAAATSSTA
jgi:hypothetical protein